ncbi:MAG: preprotein translocase subunit SecG [Mollicutes bacterium]|jgi:preprotein translocase subunit SecG|nr:preprotein translocase subunit SecG [Mollicutes bacterium]
MEVLLIIVSVTLIAIVLLQSGKAEGTAQSILGGNSNLFANRKERGGELFISRFTMLIGMLFFFLCLFLSF